MSLFSRLLNLNAGNIPLEDFFTELAAYLFASHKTILYDFLGHLNLLNSETYSEAHVLTQKTFEPLEHHHSSSRPDLVVEFISGDHRDVIFVESKIGSHEGHLQLQRYAEILDQLTGYRKRSVVYITRDFDPKDKADIFKNIPNSDVQFYQFRWHQLYHVLRSHSDIELVRETIIFMQEYRMAHNNQFSSIDVLTLSNFTKSLKIMEETMWGKTSQKFVAVLGGMKKSSTAMTQLQNFGRYIMNTSMPGQWWCGLGFSLERQDLTDYPTVSLMLEVAPNSQYREEIIEVMKIISQKDGWQGYELNNSKAWSGIVRERSLQDFLSGADHVSAIQQFFSQGLDELEAIKKQYAHLPWGVVQDGEGSSD
jgi:hypothetical protein